MSFSFVMVKISGEKIDSFHLLYVFLKATWAELLIFAPPFRGNTKSTRSFTDIVCCQLKKLGGGQNMLYFHGPLISVGNRSATSTLNGRMRVHFVVYGHDLRFQSSQYCTSRFARAG